VVVAAATAIASLGAGAASLAPQLDALYDNGALAIQTAVLTTLASVDPASATPRTQQALSGPLPLKLAAISSLFTLSTPQSITTLTDLILDPDPRIASDAMNYLSYLPAASVTPAMKANVKALLKAPYNFEIVDGVAWMAGSFGWTDFAASLAAIYPLETGDTQMNARINILWALGNIGTSAQVPIFELGLKDDQRLVALQAAASYQQITGIDVSSQVPLESIVQATTPSAKEVQEATNSIVVVETNRGVIVIQMLAEAPLNAVNFTRLVSSGFYDGLTFPRVIPDFIAQGGDPLGDGFGTSAHFVRDEFGQQPHVQGAVGLATEGKDTGSCQFFFDLTWNEQLDGSYTVFGRVLSDLSTIDSLEVGDTIEQAFVIPGLFGYP
jgi:cyclophilin family peptidyl-prolyl cis-trans isomerase